MPNTTNIVSSSIDASQMDSQRFGMSKPHSALVTNRSDDNSTPLDRVQWLGRREKYELENKGLQFDSATIERAGREVLEEYVRKVFNDSDQEDTSQSKSMDLVMDSARSP